RLVKPCRFAIGSVLQPIREMLYQLRHDSSHDLLCFGCRLGHQSRDFVPFFFPESGGNLPQFIWNAKADVSPAEREGSPNLIERKKVQWVMQHSESVGCLIA